MAANATSYVACVATIDYAAICETIEERPTIDVWPNIRRLGKNRVDVSGFPARVEVPFLIAARLSKEEADKGPQVLEILIEVFDVVGNEVVQRVDLAEPIEDVGHVTPGPVGYAVLLTPIVSLALPSERPYLVRVKGWDGQYDFLLAAFEARPAR